MTEYSLSDQDVLDQDLMVLSPPMFNSQCVKCGLPKRVLPWQVSVNDLWGPVCPSCGQQLLIQVLHVKLPSTVANRKS
jgi:hypothetical protein